MTSEPREPYTPTSHVWEGSWPPEHEAGAQRVMDVLDADWTSEGRIAFSDYFGDRVIAALLVDGWCPPAARGAQDLAGPQWLADGESVAVGDTEASILAAGTGGRWLLVGDHGEGVGIPERDWPALVAALRQLKVIPG